jgi:hypothetical protein
MNIDKYKEQFKKKGFFLIEKFYSNKEISRIKKLLKENLVNEKAIKSMVKKSIIRVENLKHTGIYDVINNEKLNTIFKIFPYKPRLFKDKYINKKNNIENSYGLHFDGLFKSFNYRLKKRTPGWYTYASKFFSLNIMLTDNSKKNGCLYVHKKLKGSPKFLLNKLKLTDKPFFENKKIYENSTPIECKKGSILIFDNLCPHYSLNNKTKKVRSNIYLTYSNAKNKKVYDLFNHDKKLLLKNIGLKKYIERTKK